MNGHWPLAVLLSISFCAGVLSSDVYFVDLSAATFHQDTSELQSISEPLFAAIAPSVMGLKAYSRIDDKVSQQLNSMIKPSPFSHPNLYLSVNLMGVTTGLMAPLKVAFPASVINKHELNDLSPQTILSSSGFLAAQNHNTKFSFLGANQMQVDNADLEEEMQAVESALCASYVSGSSPLTGKLHLGDAILDCTVEEDQMVATDIARLYTQLASVLAVSQEQHVVDVTITSLHALALKYGADSPQYAESVEAVLDTIAAALKERPSAIVQLAAIPLDASQEATTIYNTRSLLQDGSVEGVYVPDPASDRSKKFSIKAAAYGSFMLLLWFTFAGIYCMCTMPFKPDSLLYPRTKNE